MKTAAPGQTGATNYDADRIADGAPAMPVTLVTLQRTAGGAPVGRDHHDELREQQRGDQCSSSPRRFLVMAGIRVLSSAVPRVMITTIHLLPEGSSMYAAS